MLGDRGCSIAELTQYKPSQQVLVTVLTVPLHFLLSEILIFSSKSLIRLLNKMGSLENEDVLFSLYFHFFS